MLVGQNSLFYSFASLGGETNDRASGAFSFDMKNYALPEGYQLSGEGSSEWAGAGKDPIQSANDALAQAFLDWAKNPPRKRSASVYSLQKASTRKASRSFPRRNRTRSTTRSGRP